MDDIEFIKFLCKLLWDDLSDGEPPEKEDWEKVKQELLNRDIDPDEMFPY